MILHGLLGASRNWLTVARSLSEEFDLHLLDLRNHGQSPHSESMHWPELCADLALYLKTVRVAPVILVGHSLGGKIAMRFACEKPQSVDRLAVVDIAAKDYLPFHDIEFRAMKSIELGELDNRKEAEAALEPLVRDWAMRQFLLTNLTRDQSTGAFRWQANIKALHLSLPHIRKNSLREEDRYAGPSLLIRGEQSAFLEDGDCESMRKWIPHLEEIKIPKAGHNVHVENRAGFLEALRAWLLIKPSP